jgi:hypothetical protein
MESRIRMVLGMKAIIEEERIIDRSVMAGRAPRMFVITV